MRTYLGDPAFRPLFEELDRRRARLFMHPTSPACWEHTAFDRPRPMLEFLFDTTRTVVDLILNGTVARHPDIDFLIPHAGVFGARQLDALRTLTSADHLHDGSDYPFTPEFAVAAALDRLRPFLEEHP